MKRVAVVGSLNCDLVMCVPRRPGRGETVRATGFDTFVGGKGNNQALACARAGAAVSMIGRVGEDRFADLIVDKLVDAGVNCEHVTRDPDVGTGVADIWVEPDGSNSICIAPQANGRLLSAHIDAAAAVLENADVVLLQLEIPMEAVVAAARRADAAEAIVVLNPAPAEGDLDAALLAHVDVLVPNQSEAESLTGKPVRDFDGAEVAARSLIERGIPTVIVTLGELGALVVRAGSAAERVAPFDVTPIDTTAAGDAFCGALAAAFAEGRGISNAAVFASAAGALACTKLGAEPSLPRRAAIEQLVTRRSRKEA